MRGGYMEMDNNNNNNLHCIYSPIVSFVSRVFQHSFHSLCSLCMSVANVQTNTSANSHMPTERTHKHSMKEIEERETTTTNSSICANMHRVCGREKNHSSDRKLRIRVNIRKKATKRVHINNTKLTTGGGGKNNTFHGVFEILSSRTI